MTVRPEIQVCPDAAAVARTAADAVVRHVQEALVTRGRAAVTLCGGATPRLLYQLLARPPHSTRLDFAAIDFFFADERCVPPDHAASNFGMVLHNLFTPAHIESDRVHRIAGELPPAEAAREYRRELRTHFGRSTPRFDLVLLGVGTDGHVASLFPGDPALAETAAWAVATGAGEGVRDRVTLTYPVFNAARHVLFLVTGHAKAAIVAEALGGSRPADELPAAGVAPADGTLRWLLDAQAAAMLPPDGGAGPPR